MKKLISLACSLTAILCSSFHALAVNTPPSFAHDTVLLSVCANSGANLLSSYLTVTDADAGDMETWSSLVGAAHGTDVVAYTTTSTGGTLVPTGVSYTPAAGYTGNDTFVVVVTDGTDYDTITICVTVNPMPDAGVLSGKDTVCVGAAVTLSSTMTGGSWFSVTGNASAGPAGVVTGLAAGADTILYTMTNSCGADTAIYPVVVNPLPDAGFIIGAAGVCRGATITLTETEAGGVWASSKTAVASITTGGVVTGHATGKVEISYTVTNGCGTAAAADSISVDIPVLPIIDTGTSVCPGSILGLLETSPGGTWSSSSIINAFVLGTTVSGFTVGAVLGIVPGTATISYTVNNACGTSTATVDITVLSIADCNLLPLGTKTTTAIANGLSVYPNPSSGIFSLTVGGAKDEAVTISITSVTGQIVRTINTTTNKVNELTIDVPQGVYFVTAATADAKYTAKLTITK